MGFWCLFFNSCYMSCKGWHRLRCRWWVKSMDANSADTNVPQVFTIRGWAGCMTLCYCKGPFQVTLSALSAALCFGKVLALIWGVGFATSASDAGFRLGSQVGNRGAQTDPVGQLTVFKWVLQSGESLDPPPVAGSARLAQKSVRWRSRKQGFGSLLQRQAHLRRLCRLLNNLAEFGRRRLWLSSWCG